MAIDLGQVSLDVTKTADMAPIPMETKVTPVAKPQGFLDGQYHIKIGSKTLTVSKKVVWGTVAGVAGTALLIALIK